MSTPAGSQGLDHPTWHLSVPGRGLFGAGGSKFPGSPQWAQLPQRPRDHLPETGCRCPGESDGATRPLHPSTGGKQLPLVTCTSMAHTGRVEAAADILMPDKQKDPKMYLEGTAGGRKGQWLARLLKTARGAEPSRRH